MLTRLTFIGTPTPQMLCMLPLVMRLKPDTLSNPKSRQQTGFRHLQASLPQAGPLHALAHPLLVLCAPFPLLQVLSLGWGLNWCSLCLRLCYLCLVSGRFFGLLSTALHPLSAALVSCSLGLTTLTPCLLIQST
jgi:hypothetical protein